LNTLFFSHLTRVQCSLKEGATRYSSGNGSHLLGYDKDQLELYPKMCLSTTAAATRNKELPLHVSS